jgi:hypothetical protein
VALDAMPAQLGPAEAYYQQARALAETLGMRPLQAHCYLGLGSLYARTGQGPQARLALSTAVELYQAMGMSGWQSQGEAVLTRSGVSTEWPT